MPDPQKAPAATNGAATAYQINTETFAKRLKMLYASWRERASGGPTELWSKADILSICTPPASEDLRYLKSSALNIWLFGYEFPETVMVFTGRRIHFICSAKKASLLEVVKEAAREAAGVEVVMHVKARAEDGGKEVERVVRAVREEVGGRKGAAAVVVGCLLKEAPEGKLLEIWDERVKGEDGFEVVDVTNGLSEMFAVKDKDELQCIKKAAFLTASVMKNHVVPKLEKVRRDGGGLIFGFNS